MSSPSENRPRLAVVGGGISGLTAAYRLTQLLPNADVQLFEASGRLGGVLQTRRDGELLLEQGADSFLNKLPHAFELCQELGLADELIPTNEQHRRALVWHDGTLHPVPEGFVVIRPTSMWQMMKTRLLSWQGKSRLLAEPFLSAPADVDREDFDISVADFAKRRLGREAFERLVQPLLAGIYTADATKLSLAATMPEVITALREHGSLYRAAVSQAQTKEANASGARYASFVTPRQGLIHLVQTLTDRIGREQIHLNSAVNALRRSDQGQWHLSVNQEESTAFDGVILALPAPRAAELVQDTDSLLAEGLQSIEYASSAVVCLTYDQADLTRSVQAFGIVVPHVEQRPIVAASFSSMKFPGRAPEGKLLVRVFLGGALHPKMVDKDDEELVSIAAAEMQLMIGAPDKPLSAHVVRWMEKMPQYHVGHAQRIAKIETRVAEQPGLELAGNAYHGVGIPQCVRSGDEAARRLAKCLSQANQQ